MWPFVIQFRLGPANVYHPKVSDVLRDVFNASFLYKWTGDTINSLGAVPSTHGSWQERVTDLGEYVFFPALFVLVVAGFFLALRAQRSGARKQGSQSLVFAGAAIACVFLMVFLHLAVHIDYPISRYCLFLIPLFTVGAILAAREIQLLFPSPFLIALGMLLAAIVVSDYTLSLQTKSFRYNAYDVISRDLYEAIANDARSRSLTTVRVGGTWWYEAEINYYRRRNNATWMVEYDIKDRSYWWQTPNSLTPRDYDYFIFTLAGDPGLAGPHVRTIFRDPLIGVTVVANDK